MRSRQNSLHADCMRGFMKAFIAVSFVLFLSANIHGTQAAAVMSIDLGTEWIKVGVVSPGVPMEIALNKESKRKTPSIISFRDGVRNFGEDAVTVGIRDPSAAYGYLLDLLGKTIDNPIVDLYRQRFPYYNLIADETRNTIIFKKSDTEQFSVEELISQMLLRAKDFAEDATHQSITECVLTVPAYFGQAERQALLTAAKLADLKVLQLINDYAAVALNYGVFNRANINETAQYFIFYDMGAYKTSAVVVSYQLVKDKQTKEVNPVIQVLGVGYDRTLGGLEIQLRLRDHLATEFNKLKKTTTDVKSSPRALAKLFKEAGRLKNVLSANNDHFAQIENLIEDHDFKLHITRETLEDLCSDLWPRVTKPLDQALAASGLSLDVVSQVIIFGGGTRVPKVQEVLKGAIQKELGKSLNADEAATMGAVYKAADLTSGFKVKKFVIKDAAIFPIQVSFERDPGNGSSIKQVKRMLFGHMNSYPQKKMITFNKHTDDFDFYVHYGDLNHLSAEEVSYLGSLNISHVELQQVKEIIEKNRIVMVDSKGIKAHFLLDESGIFKLSNVEYVYEKQDTEQEDEGTLAKLGSTISKLFSKDTEQTDEENATKDDQHEEKPAEADKEIPPHDSENKADDDENSNTNQTNTAAGSANVNAKNETYRVVTVKEPIQYKLRVLHTNPLSGSSLEKSLEKLQAINKAEFERNRLESAFNALESHVIEIQQKLQEDEYESCVTPEEKEAILNECSAISDWLYEDIDNPTPDIYEKRLTELKARTDVFMARHWEHEERPQAMKALNEIIDAAKKFLNKAKNMTKEKNPENDVFTNVEVETLTKVIDDTVEWKTNEAAAQKKLKRYEEVRLTVKDISDKMSLLDREVKYLINKLKIWKPKPKVTNKEKSKENKTNDAETSKPSAEEPGSGNDNQEANKTEEQVDPLQAQSDKEEDNVVKGTKVPEDTTPRSDL